MFAPLALLEAALRICVAPSPPSLVDPYVSFQDIRPLFVLDSSGSRYETAGERLEFFRKQSFAARKKEGTFRVFCLGGSTVQGRPYSVETSFSAWLEIDLRAGDPQSEYEVVNCGGVSYASYRLVPVMREVLEYEPDLFVIYTGHNEFLEDRTYRRVKETPGALIRMHRLMTGFRSYDLLHRILAPREDFTGSDGSEPKTLLPVEVKARLDFRDGLDAYTRDEDWRRGTVEHFRENLEKMALMAKGAGIPVILVNPAYNLKDCPPFKSEFGDGISMRDREGIMELLAAGRGDGLG